MPDIIVVREPAEPAPARVLEAVQSAPSVAYEPQVSSQELRRALARENCTAFKAAPKTMPRERMEKPVTKTPLQPKLGGVSLGDHLDQHLSAAPLPVCNMSRRKKSIPP